eukprot:3728489-Pyramimonas_sp.AAC.1
MAARPPSHMLMDGEGRWQDTLHDDMYTTRHGLLDLLMVRHRDYDHGWNGSRRQRHADCCADDFEVNAPDVFFSSGLPSGRGLVAAGSSQSSQVWHSATQYQHRPRHQARSHVSMGSTRSTQLSSTTSGSGTCLATGYHIGRHAKQLLAHHL